jgi:hypothetical protein
LADPVITEFMASNKTTLADDDGEYSDWVEIHNPDAAPVSLARWSLTDNAKKKTKWQFPAVVIPPDGYLVVFASGKDRSDPARPLHTSFKLSADNSYLGLIKPDGITAATEFSPSYPPQAADISYGLTQPTDPAESPRLGYFRTPTPGARNGGLATLTLPEQVTFSAPPGLFRDSLTLTLSGADPGQKIRFVIAPPSAAGAAVPEPTAESPEYAGPIVLTSSAIVRAAVFSDDDSVHGVAQTAQFVQLASAGDQRLDTFASQLPLLVIDDHGAGPLEKDGIDHPAWIYGFAPDADGISSLASAPAFAVPLTFTVHGSSSATFPKKSFGLKLKTTLGTKQAVAPFGLPAFDKWQLIGPWNFDPSFIRAAYVYALSNRIGRWAPRTRFAEVFFNHNGDSLDGADYAGIYVLTDKVEIDPQRVNLASLTPADVAAPAVTGGYLLKIDQPDATHYSWSTNRGFPDTAGYQFSQILVDTPSGDVLAPAQRDYIRGYVQTMEDALYADLASGWATRSHLNYLDRDSWIDFHLINIFVRNVDMLQLSTYLTKDRGGKLTAGPVWDFDRSMGSADPRTADWDRWSDASTFDYWNFGWWGVLAHDPDYMQAWIDRWQALRNSQFSDQNLAGLADSLGAQIGPEAAARDAARWPDDASRYGDIYGGEISRIKDWITHRAQWIDAQFVPAPIVTGDDVTHTVFPAPGVQIAYTLDGTDPRQSGGGMAATATLTSNPVTVPATANLRVRSYRDGPAAFPGSPWSSLVIRPDPSFLPPSTSRLANLSARAVVTSGDSILIGGVVVTGAPEKRLLVRAVGPGLSDLGINRPLPDPILRLVNHAGLELARNEGWEKDPEAGELPVLAATVGAFPLAAGSRDAALVARLPAGVYSLQVSSASQQPGIALIELYELDQGGRTINLSARGPVRAGNGLLIGGLVISGSATKRVLVRAVGPTLATLGVSQPLADPVLTLYSGSEVVTSNDDWGTGDRIAIAGAATAVGAFALPDDSKDSALLVTLSSGVYSVLVSSKDGKQGVALVEIYEVP